MSQADKICWKCGAAFGCGPLAGAEQCWCADLPPAAIEQGADCLCPQCLAAAEPQAAPEPDFYMESGFVVFTAAYHLRRGFCCGSGCRHCPYD